MKKISLAALWLAFAPVFTPVFTPVFAPAFAQTPASFDARLLDAQTNEPIAGATLVLGTAVTTTNAAGHFHLAASTGQAFARAPGYRAIRFDLAAPSSLAGTLKLSEFTPRALYLSIYGAGSSILRGAALDLIHAGGPNAPNTLVIDVKGDRGLLPYPSAIPLATQIGARKITTIPNLAALVQSLHQQGIYVIARIVTFKDDPLATARPDLAVKRKSGVPFSDREGLHWTDPFQPEVRAYDTAIAVEAAQAGFDEIQFDYLRFPDAPQGLKFSQDATEASRVAAIKSFLAGVKQQLLPYNVYLSADIFGYVCWNQNDTGIGQHLEDIAPEVDYLSPMLYPSGFQFGIPGYRKPVANSYELVHASLENALKRLGISPQRFRPWLQAFRDYGFDHRVFTADEVGKQIKAADDIGTDGWLLWNPRNDYDEDGLNAPQPPAAKTTVAAAKPIPAGG
jgi:hypothetical protein